MRVKISILFAALPAFFLLATPAYAEDPWPPEPTGTSIDADAKIQTEMNQAWDDSDADDEQNRHEEGGWIVQCRNRETEQTAWQYYLKVVRVPKGKGSSIDSGTPPSETNCRVIGFFHTHPNPPPWKQGPSDADTNWHTQHGIPGIIRNSAGTAVFGPASGTYQ